MKVVAAIDSFKGSMTSLEVAAAFEKGVKKVYKDAEFIKIPLADGGEGTVKALIDNLDGKMVNIKVKDPLMRDIDSFYGISGDGKTAVIEMAAASGLPLLSPDERNPLKATTFGTGELIKDALEKGCREFIIGIGGSATNDAGTGMLSALGYIFLDENGNELEPNGENLINIKSFKDDKVMKEVSEAKFLIACDVDNPFYGTNGAAHVYGKQKGATGDIIKILDDGMRNFSNVIEKIKKTDISNISGSGAAGGLGGAFTAFFNSELKPGIDIITEKIELENKINGSDYVITGEGRIDFQSAMGKTPSGVAKLAKKYGIPVIAIGGSVDDEIGNIYDCGITAAFSIIDSPMTLGEAMDTKNAQRLVEKTAEQIFRLIKQNKKN
ncbi:Glycerate kinase [Sebaldella termitidis]|uniref:Glycerate kinase n=1 Tax=Sebaldella termitidis (strain ATCC 33386 / NCTC 11300) TaxID=526218 RepID=D1ARF0_SEBTE|nr:glycerate kinase [Sebaldella termitidis]ACZ10436.1 glycerate kinase [Sebaldella termitidis ATCC 33386]MBP7979371.1 glycerate kinase [Sebaldella sp.]SUI25778.1 Glycerate kinase [Sebaldella termitidis]